jgi:opacity protein-like surface antigen
VNIAAARPSAASTPTAPASNDYYGTKSEWLFLANAYIDLGTWWCVTPFIGAGIGYSQNTIDNWRDQNNQTGATAYADNNSQWEMAWALHAGIAYKVTPNFTAEFAYRYVNLGDFASGDMIGFNGQNSTYNPINLNNVCLARLQAGSALESVADRVVCAGCDAVLRAGAVRLQSAAAGLFAAPPLMRKG